VSADLERSYLEPTAWHAGRLVGDLRSRGFDASMAVERAEDTALLTIALGEDHLAVIVFVADPPVGVRVEARLVKGESVVADLSPRGVNGVGWGTDTPAGLVARLRKASDELDRP
jgi:hypothetical protein